MCHSVFIFKYIEKYVNINNSLLTYWVPRTQTQRAAQCVLGWRIGGAFSLGNLSDNNRESMTEMFQRSCVHKISLLYYI